MPTQPYYNAKGDRLPSNTQVINQNLGWSKGGLMYWAWQQGKDGKDFRETRDQAADAGTLGHALIEHDIKKLPEPDLSKYTPDVIAKARRAFDNYREWRDQTHLELITMEAICVSELYRFGTCCDILAIVAGKLSIVEVKTSNDVYPEMLIQIAAQVQAWNETHVTFEKGYADQIEACYLLKIGKEDATFSLHWFAPEALLPAFEAFKLLRGLHDYKKALAKLI